MAHDGLSVEYIVHVQRVIAAAMAFVISCTPHACSEEDARALEREVAFLVGEPGPVADEAERRLIERGESAIAVLETGLYQGDARGRRRVVRVLESIGSSEALPILDFLAGRDPDPDVRATAERSAATIRSQ